MVDVKAIDTDISAMMIRLQEHIETMHASEPCFGACFDVIMALEDYKKTIRYAESVNHD